MNTRDYFAECFKAEKPKFIRVLQAIPSDQAGYRPHPRSNSAADIAWLLASELGDACELVDFGKVDFVLKPTPAKIVESVASYEKNAGELERRLPTLDDAAWGKKARFLVDGNVAWEASLGDMLFGFLFDAIHHRGQLSAYLRPMGAKVPSIYGPSADDAGA
ncbi:MAG: DinB family protein [Thermoanaerobaculia bacterium]